MKHNRPGKGIEVLENRYIEAYLKYLKHGTDYRNAFREDSARAKKELSEAAQRRADEMQRMCR